MPTIAPPVGWLPVPFNIPVRPATEAAGYKPLTAHLDRHESESLNVHIASVIRAGQFRPSDLCVFSNANDSSRYVGRRVGTVGPMRERESKARGPKYSAVPYRRGW